jgi:hypothetical protein
MPIAPQGRHWMWASGHNGYSHAAKGYEATREAAMAAFAESWRRETKVTARGYVPAREPIRARPANSEWLVLVL